VTWLLAVPILGLLAIFQTAVASRIVLLQGTADLVLVTLVAWAIHPRSQYGLAWALIGGLIVGALTGLPVLVPVAAYLAAAGVALFLKKRVWQIPLLAMLIAVILSTFISLALAWGVLQLEGVPLPIFQSFYLVLLPSTLLNLLLAVPAYVLAGDLAGWLYPQEFEI
jgi:hypothetical protein